MDKPLGMRLRLTKTVDTRLPMFDNTTDYVTAVVGTIAGNYSGGEAVVEWRG